MSTLTVPLESVIRSIRLAFGLQPGEIGLHLRARIRDIEAADDLVQNSLVRPELSDGGVDRSPDAPIDLYGSRPP